MGVIGAASSLVQLRANRLVPGMAEHLSAAGPFAWGVWAALAIALVAAIGPAPARKAASLLAAPALLTSTSWAVGSACQRLLVGQPSVARVSLDTGAWVLLASAATLALAASQVAPAVRASRRLLVALGIAAAAAAVPRGGLGSLALAREFSVRSATFWPLLLGHAALSGASLAAGVGLGVPLGLWASRSRRVRAVVLGVAGVIQTVPSLALLGLLVVPLAAIAAAVPALAALGLSGIGAAPGFIVLTLYALLPIVRGTYVGLMHVDSAAIDAALGMGMNRRQLLARVELPLAAPLVVDGIRTAAVLVVGITTLTSLAGARNLGVMIFEGLGQFAPDLILLGALPVVALAVLVDDGFGWLARVLTPKGVRT